MTNEGTTQVKVTMDLLMSDEEGVVAKQLDEVTHADGSLVIGMHVNEPSEPVPTMHINIIGFRSGTSRTDVLEVLREVIEVIEGGLMLEESMHPTMKSAEQAIAKPFPQTP